MSVQSAIETILAQTRIEARPYQARIVTKAVRMFLGKHRNGTNEVEPAARSVMIESPTGSGKTVIGLLVARTLQQLAGVRIGWVAMRRNLLQQAQAENREKGIGVDPIRFISMFEKEPLTDIDLLILDEGHHDAAGSMAHLHNVIRPCWILGLTATPFRTDRVQLCFDKTVKDAGIRRLIQDGYLSEYDHYTVPKWDVGQLADLYCSEPERWGKSVFLFHSVAECHALDLLLRERGVRSDVVTGTSDRESQLEAFRRDDLHVLVNCMVLTEGFDDPTLQTAQADAASLSQDGPAPTAVPLGAGRLEVAHDQLEDSNLCGQYLPGHRPDGRGTTGLPPAEASSPASPAAVLREESPDFSRPSGLSQRTRVPRIPFLEDERWSLRASTLTTPFPPSTTWWCRPSRTSGRASLSWPPCW